MIPIYRWLYISLFKITVDVFFNPHQYLVLWQCMQGVTWLQKGIVFPSWDQGENRGFFKKQSYNLPWWHPEIPSICTQWSKAVMNTCMSCLQMMNYCSLKYGNLCKEATEQCLSWFCLKLAFFSSCPGQEHTAWKGYHSDLAHLTTSFMQQQHVLQSLKRRSVHMHQNCQSACFWHLFFPTNFSVGTMFHVQKMSQKNSSTSKLATIKRDIQAYK